MKKIILASLLLLLGSSTYAATACSAGTATPVPGAAGNFVRVPFNPACSANVEMVYTDDAANQKLYAGSASTKGASYFGASTLGGTISPVGKCANSTCGGAEAGTKAAAGMAAAQNYGT